MFSCCLGRKVTALSRFATDQELRSSCPGTRPLGGESASRTCIPETSCPVGRQPFLPWDYFRFARDSGANSRGTLAGCEQGHFYVYPIDQYLETLDWILRVISPTPPAS